MTHRRLTDEELGPVLARARELYVESALLAARHLPYESLHRQDEADNLMYAAIDALAARGL